MVSFTEISITSSKKKISILIPARNEENSILTLLNSISKLEYQNYEVLILDDESTDNTYKIVYNFTKHNPKFQVTKGKQLPDGWTGKNYACRQLANTATGDYLLSVDADVKLTKKSISSAIAYLQGNSLTLLSLFCDQKMKTLGEIGVIPLMNYMLLTLLPIKLILKNRDPIFSAACGQFMLFNAKHYFANQWHELVADEVTEDLKIVRINKQNRYKCDALLSNGLVSCRMYSGHMQAINGFSKNLITPFNDNIWIFSIYLYMTIVAPIFIILSNRWYVSVAISIMVILTKIFISLSSKQSILWKILLHPVQILNLLFIGSLAIFRKKSQSGEWKGRSLYVKS